MAQKPAKAKKGSAPTKKEPSVKAGSQKVSSSSGKAKAGARAAKKSKPRRPGELSRFQKGVIIAFIAVFALSTLASAFASMMQGEQQQATQDSTDTLTVASMDERYQPMVSELEGKVAADDTDKASLLSLGRYCLQWGSAVRMLGTTDADTSHANELFEKAISAYDKYLALEDSSAVRVDRALCQYYEGETSEAQVALEELTEKDPEYAPAWANLGMILEATGSTDDAKAAYQKAIATDPDDEYQAKSYAEQRLQAIDKAAEEASSEDSGSGSSDSASTDSEAGSEGTITDDGGSEDASGSDDTASDNSAEEGQSLTDELASGAGL